MLYDRVRHGQLGSVYGGHDPGVCSRIHAAKAVWLLGYPDQALRTIEAALTMATELSHPYTSMVGPVGGLLDTSSPRGQAGCSGPCGEAARTSDGAVASTLDKDSKFFTGLVHGRAGSMGAGYSADAPG